MRKKFLHIMISIVLILAICFTTCTSAFAATSQTKYISDIIICNAKDEIDAENQLKAKGYKLLSDENINQSLSDGMYIGYKTTTNPDEAITNIASMNMTGNYSFSDYEILLNSMKEDVDKTVDGLIPMIIAYRENYKAGNAIAIEVYTILNKFYEDDSAKLLGDYLLTCDLVDKTDLTKVFLQGYSPFIIDIQQLLFLAGESENDKNWIEKMASSDPEALIDLYMDSYKTPNKAFSALVADYGETAEEISVTWDSFYETLKSATESYYTEKGDDLTPNQSVFDKKIEDAKEISETEIEEGMTDDELVDSIVDNTTAATVIDNIIDATLVSYLLGIEYDDGTMLDFFMRPISEVDDNELYTLAYFMGKKLSAQVTNVGLTQVISRVIVDGKNSTANKFEEFNESFNKIDKVSIYNGVDRSLFENGVALTGPTVEKFVASGKSWSDDLFDRLFQPSGQYKWDDYLAFYIIPTAASLIMFTFLAAVNKAMSLIASKASSFVKKSVYKSVGIELIYNNPSTYTMSQLMKKFPIGFIAYGKGTTCRNVLSYRIVANIRGAFFFLTMALVIVDIIMLFVTLTADDDDGIAKYEAIPNHIVDTVSTKYGDDYVAYNHVNNILGSAGDINNYKGRAGWFVLYYTKDKLAGNPITPDFKVIKGSTNTPLDYDCISMFGSKDAVNITSQEHTGVKDPVNGTYIYFSRGDVSTIGSAFSNGYLAIALGLGVGIGIIIGTLSSKIVYKKKKKALA